MKETCAGTWDSWRIYYSTKASECLYLTAPSVPIPYHHRGSFVSLVIVNVGFLSQLGVLLIWGKWLRLSKISQLNNKCNTRPNGFPFQKLGSVSDLSKFHFKHSLRRNFRYTDESFQSSWSVNVYQQIGLWTFEQHPFCTLHMWSSVITGFSFMCSNGQQHVSSFSTLLVH